MLVRSFSIFVHREKYGSSSRQFFDDTILEFIDKMSEASKDDIDALFEAPLLVWEATPPAPASPIPGIGKPHPSFAHTSLRAKNMNANTAKSTGTWVK